MQSVSAAAASPETNAEQASALILARGLSKTYVTASGAVTALKNLNFEIYDGEFVSVVGQSGCGKSTLLKVLAGLLPYTTGSVELNGKPLRGPTPQAAVVFQSPVLLPWRTVLDNVLLPIEFRKLPMANYRKSATDLLAMVGLSEFAQRYPFELSGGMQQRTAIVRALVQDPRLLLMDEPFGALDAMTRDALNLELQRIWMETRKTITVVTHSIIEAVFLADRIVLLSPRPGHIDTIYDVPFARPRPIDLQSTAPFQEIALALRHRLSEIS